jgi:hypothetical protein
MLEHLLHARAQERAFRALAKLTDSMSGTGALKITAGVACACADLMGALRQVESHDSLLEQALHAVRLLTHMQGKSTTCNRGGRLRGHCRVHANAPWRRARADAGVRRDLQPDGRGPWGFNRAN